MNLGFLVGIIIVLIVCGFIWWAVKTFAHLIPGPPIIHQAIDAILIVLIVAIILFYVIVPLLQMVAGIHIQLPQVGR